MVAEDVNQINEWIKNYSDTFFNYIHARLKDKTAAKDILQETFIAAWKSRRRFKKEAGEKTWLYSILKNKLVDHYRMQSRSITDLADNNYYFDDGDHWSDISAPKQWNNAAASLNKKEFYIVLNHVKVNLTAYRN